MDMGETDLGEADPVEPRLVVVLPVYNEADSIRAVLAEVKEAAARLALTGVDTTCILVDDNSPDDTGAIAQRYAKSIDLDIAVVSGERNGLGDAMLRGLAAALATGPTAVVTLDGDGQHDPSDIPTLYRAFDARGADIAIGSRWTRGGSAPGTSAARTVGSRLGNWLFRSVTGTRGVKDATTSFRVYSPAALRFLLTTNSRRYRGYSFFSTTIALADAAGLKITEVPIEFRPRYNGHSKLSRAEVWRYFRSLPELRHERRELVGGEAAAPHSSRSDGSAP
jgi:dolichol-phosphate mannosyltransferase